MTDCDTSYEYTERVLIELKKSCRDSRDSSEKIAEWIETELDGIPDKYAEFYRGKASGYDDMQNVLSEWISEQRQYNFEAKTEQSE